jgi:hypothetical protein
MADQMKGARFPAVSIVLFVLAGLAFVLFVYFVFAALSAPAAFNGIAPVLSAALGPLAGLVLNPLKQTASILMALLALLNLFVGGLLVALGLVLRNHRDLAMRVAALEERVGKLDG